MIKGVTPDAQDKVYFPAKTFTFFSVVLSHVGTDDFSPLALSVAEVERVQKYCTQVKVPLHY